MNGHAICSGGGSDGSEPPSCDYWCIPELTTETNCNSPKVQNGVRANGAIPVCDRDCDLHVPDRLVDGKWKDFSHLKIDFHINYEIVQKHNELRLIEQELAKCMISLEQLRRCHVLPDPKARQETKTAALAASPKTELKSRLRKNPKKTEKASGFA